MLYSFVDAMAICAFQDEAAIRLVDASPDCDEYRPISLLINYFSGWHNSIFLFGLTNVTLIPGVLFVCMLFFMKRVMLLFTGQILMGLLRTLYWNAETRLT